MTDFDFDELDKAVSGAIGGEPETPPGPQPAVTSEPPVIQAVSTPAPRPTPAMRRGGRFMDMVHSSSDMRSRTPGGTSESQSTPADVVAPKPSVEPETSALDVSPKTNQPVELATPLESPFLPDAKVEKRPLGGGESGLHYEGLSGEPENELLDAPDDPRLDATTMPDPIDFAEQQGELPTQDVTGEVDLEAAAAVGSDLELSEPPAQPENDVHDEAVGVPQASLGMPESSEPTPIVDRAPIETIQETDVADQPQNTQPEASPEPVGPTSITQQYKEQPSSAAESGAIYDTEAYHKPLTPVAKKRSGVWIILWIFLLVVLGAGAGAAFYLYVLPML